MLSAECASILVDLIENKLASMHVGDREDLREIVGLQRCLAELKGIDAIESGVLKNFSGMEIPRRGRRRKVSSMIGDQG